MTFGSPTFWRFLRYARPYRFYIIGSVATGVVKFTLALLLPFAMGYSVDHIILADIPGDEKMNRLLQMSAILIAVFIGRIPIAYYRSYWAELAGNRTIFDIRNALYAHVQSLGLAYHGGQRTGATTSRLTNDINQAQGILDRGVMSVGVDFIFLVGVVIFLFFENWQLATASLFTLPMYALVFGLLNPRLRVASQRSLDEMSHLSGEINEKLTGHSVVMSFVRERSERLRFMKLHRKYYNEVMVRTRIHVSMFQVGEFFTMVGPLVVTLVGTWLAVKGSIRPGELVAFSGYLAHLYLPTRRLADASAAVQMQLAGMDRVFAILDVQPDIADGPDAKPLRLTEGRITFEDVHFSYLDDQPVIEGITLDVEPGTAVAIVGRSGGGKSTLVKLVPRFYDVKRGAIRIDGQDIREVTLHSLREKIGMVMQDAILFGGSVRENILYGRRGATEEEMLEAARMAHVDEFVDELPLGYDTLIGERGVTLSGGQKQRLSIARAFLRDPEILILDEATSSLDSHAENVIQEALERLMKGRTTLVIAHRLATVVDCDRVVVIEDGRIVQDGTHDALINEEGPYRALCEEQFGAVQLEDLAG